MTQTIYSTSNPNLVYDYYDKYFESLPQVLIDHRFYFEQERRGYGERAFHAMHYLLFKAFRPRSILEIGVYRGQALSLFSLCAALENIEAEIFGITPLIALGDDDSTYPNIDYLSDITVNLHKFSVSNVKLLRAKSNEISARRLIKSRRWDYIYIDGAHDYQSVLIDYINCADQLSDNGVLIMDDSNIHTGFSKNGAFSGHFGPSEVKFRWASKELVNFLNVGHNSCFKLST
jgi:hypothetical protein